MRLIRPKQWSKNLLVFAALLFTQSYGDSILVGRSLVAFAAMCLVSSAVYVLNDLLDAERDRNHPIKRDRPIASGRISAAFARWVGLVLLGAGVGLTLVLGASSCAVVVGYLVLQVAYNVRLKQIAVADVFTISLGFVLRAVLGASALDVSVSAWLLLCTGMLALLMGFAKRRHEYILQGEERTSSRESLAHYTRGSLDGFVLVSAGAAAMSYGVYAIESPTATRYPGLIVTCVFVFYGIYRYVFLAFSQDEGGEPETLLFTDPHMIVVLVLFTASAIAAMSGLQIPFIEVGVPR